MADLVQDLQCGKIIFGKESKKKAFHRGEARNKNIENHGLSFKFVWCEQSGSRWLTTSSWQARGTLKVFKYINMVLDGFLQHRDL